MELSEALIMALACTLIYLGVVGRKIADAAFSSFRLKKRKEDKLKKLLAARETPLQGSNLRRNLRRSFERVLIPLCKADKSLLPARMDQNFRRRIERQIELLSRRGLRRDIRLTDVVPQPENDFQQWNDDGREWREGLLQCCTLERLVPTAGGEPVWEVYRKNTRLRVLQSRHIRSVDRTEEKGSYYDGRFRINCPSCGAQVQLSSQQVVCPYCGGVIQSDFYDWQTEAFELHEEVGDILFWTLLMFASAAILFLCLFLCLWGIKDTQISLTIGVATAFFICMSLPAAILLSGSRQKRLAGKISLYSENYLRSCINEAMYQESPHPDLMDYSIDTLLLKKVIHTEETTTIKVRVRVSEIYLPAGERPYMKKRRRTLILQRARYPEKRKSNGSFFAERDCPSCGANFIPDENNCCSFCGYSQQVSNAKWTVKTIKK